MKSNNISIKNYYEKHLKIYRVYFALFWKYFRWKNINIDNEGFGVLLESLRIYCTIFLLLIQCCTCCIDYVSWKGYVVYTNLKMLAIWYILLLRSRATPRQSLNTMKWKKVSWIFVFCIFFSYWLFCILVTFSKTVITLFHSNINQPTILWKSRAESCLTVIWSVSCKISKEMDKIFKNWSLWKIHNQAIFCFWGRFTTEILTGRHI